MPVVNPIAITGVDAALSSALRPLLEEMRTVSAYLAEIRAMLAQGGLDAARRTQEWDRKDAELILRLNEQDTGPGATETSEGPAETGGLGNLMGPPHSAGNGTPAETPAPSRETYRLITPVKLRPRPSARPHRRTSRIRSAG